MKLPLGFEGASERAGIKPSGSSDLALIYSPFPLSWAMTTTSNQLKAPFIARNRSRYRSQQPIRAVAINSGIANCLTGEQGVWDNEDFAGAVAQNLGISIHQVLTLSTGVLGERLPVDKIRQVIPNMIPQLHEDSSDIAQAIMTTDTRPKQVAVNLDSGAKVVGIAKGSGMIHPNMATMLAFIMTDADVSEPRLRRQWANIVARSFNQISVDGDMSPNDSALLLASRQSYAPEEELFEALQEVCNGLAQSIARDGEGASKLITCRVTGGRDEKEALKASKSVIQSPLVKTAVHGNDPNWGRIISAMGAAGTVLDLARVGVRLQGETVYSMGQPQAFDASKLSQKMRREEVVIDIDLGRGDSHASAWGCDLSAEYVAINAEYTT